MIVYGRQIPESRGRYSRIPTESSGGGSQVGGDASPSDSPGLVRILVRSVPAGGAEQAVCDPEEIEGDLLIGQYEHLGPLDPETRDAFVRICDKQIREIESKLAVERDPTSSKELLEEAGLFFRLITLHHEKKALLTGSYLTTRPGVR